MANSETEMMSDEFEFTNISFQIQNNSQDQT